MKKMKVVIKKSHISILSKMSLTIVKGIFCIVLIFFTTNIFSQATVFEGNIRKALHTKPKIKFKLDNRNSFVTNSFARTFGVKAALDFNKILEFGIGYNFLISNYRKYFNAENRTLYYNYFSPYLQYNILLKSKFEIQLPVQFCIGNSYFEYFGKTYNKSLMISYEPAITFLYKPFPFLGLGAGTGYRLMIVSNTKIDEKFTSPIYLYKIIFFFNTIFKNKD